MCIVAVTERTYSSVAAASTCFWVGASFAACSRKWSSGSASAASARDTRSKPSSSSDASRSSASASERCSDVSSRATPGQREGGKGKGRTVAVDVRVLAEALLHAAELVDAIDALGLGLGVDKAREGRLEVLAAGPVGHAAEARAVPVDLARFRVERRLLGRRVGGGRGRVCCVGDRLLGRLRLVLDRLLGRLRLIRHGLLGRLRLARDRLLGRVRLVGRRLLCRLRLVLDGLLCRLGLVYDDVLDRLRLVDDRLLGRVSRLLDRASGVAGESCERARRERERRERERGREAGQRCSEAMCARARREATKEAPAPFLPPTHALREERGRRSRGGGDEEAATNP